MRIDFFSIENGAHQAATSPHNSISPPTDKQAKAGNYKMGRIRLHGLDIAIENTRGSYRSGRNPDTGLRWTSRLAAHYGYFPGTLGNDGDPVDCFVGEWPYADRIYVINQYFGDDFDEHKVMIGFHDRQAAANAYQFSYERGWIGLKSIIPCTITQFKWWLANGNKSRPLQQSFLPHEGTENMTMRHIFWGNDALPQTIDIDRLLYNLRKDATPEAGDLLMDSATLQDILEDAEEMPVLDALVRPYRELERTAGVMQKVMNRVDTELQVSVAEVSPLVTRNGTAQVNIRFALSDGQSIAVYFHNPDVTPKKVMPMDDMISFKWVLNKRDITIVVAPEQGKDLDVNEVARRVMQLAKKNSTAFRRANARKDSRDAKIAGLRTEISDLEKELERSQRRLEAAKIAAESKQDAGQDGVAIEDLEEEEGEEVAAGATNQLLWSNDGDRQVMIDLAINKLIDYAKSTLGVTPKVSTRYVDTNPVSGEVNIYRGPDSQEVKLYASTPIPPFINGGDVNPAFNAGRSRFVLGVSAFDLDKLYFFAGDGRARKKVEESTFVKWFKEQFSTPDKGVELTGKELGDFPDTPEGKKSLRQAAKQHLEGIIGTWVHCPALSGDVEIRRNGVKKIISLSGDPRKLRLVASIGKLIGSAKKISSKPPYLTTENNIVAYHIRYSPLSRPISQEIKIILG